MTGSSKAIGTISCILRVSEQEQSAALPQALTLAEACAAHLVTTVIAPKAHVPFSLIGGAYVAPMIADINKRSVSDAETLITTAQKKLQSASLSGEVHLNHNHVDAAAAQAVRSARASDLIVVDQSSAMLDTKGLVLEEALFRSGRPVLIASPAKQISSVSRICVAWDGSPHAARSLGDALALFPEITSVDIVVVKGEKDLSNNLPGADLAHHLARKGLETKLVELQATGRTVGKVLDDYAVEANVDLLVMGGFGHSRFREFLFGGVTVELTQSARVPLLMAY